MALLDTMFDRATLMFPTTESVLARLLEVTSSAISIFVDSAHSDFFLKVWLTIASFLACFNIQKARDETGREIEIEDTYSPEVLTYAFWTTTTFHNFDNAFNSRRKLPFKCSIQPRSEQIRMLIESTRDR